MRRGAVRSRLAEWLDASLTLQASIRRMLGGRKAEETIYLPERMAAEEMIKRGDPGGRGLWLGAGVAVLSSLPRCLVKGGMWEDVGKVMSLVFVSRSEPHTVDTRPLVAWKLQKIVTWRL